MTKNETYGVQEPSRSGSAVVMPDSDVLDISDVNIKYLNEILTKFIVSELSTEALNLKCT